MLASYVILLFALWTSTPDTLKIIPEEGTNVHISILELLA